MKMIRVKIYRKARMTQGQPYKVRQQGGNATPLEMFAKSKQTFKDGKLDRLIPFTELHKTQQNVMNGVLVPDETFRKYGQFGYKLEKEEVSENILSNPKTVKYLDYSEKLQSQKRPLEKVETIIEFPAEEKGINYLVQTSLLMRRIIKGAGISDYKLYKKFTEKGGKFKLNVDCEIYVYDTEDTTERRSTTFQEKSLKLPQFIIKKVLQHDTPVYRNVDKMETLKGRSIIEKGFSLAVESDNGVYYPVIDVTSKSKEWENFQPHILAEHTHSVFMCSNQARLIQQHITFTLID